MLREDRTGNPLPAGRCRVRILVERDPPGLRQDHRGGSGILAGAEARRNHRRHPDGRTRAIALARFPFIQSRFDRGRLRGGRIGCGHHRLGRNCHRAVRGVDRCIGGFECGKSGSKRFGFGFHTRASKQSRTQANDPYGAHRPDFPARPSLVRESRKYLFPSRMRASPLLFGNARTFAMTSVSHPHPHAGYLGLSRSLTLHEFNNLLSETLRQMLRHCPNTLIHTRLIRSNIRIAAAFRPLLPKLQNCPKLGHTAPRPLPDCPAAPNALTLTLQWQLTDWTRRSSNAAYAKAAKRRSARSWPARSPSTSNSPASPATAYDPATSSPSLPPKNTSAAAASNSSTRSP